MLPPELVIATSNAHKVMEIYAILRSLGEGDVRLLSLNDVANHLAAPDESGATFAQNAEIKARFYAAATGFACLADDSGLCVDALRGAPGIYSSRYADDDKSRIARLLAELEAIGATQPDRRKARFVCAACIATPSGTVAFAQGECEGVIATYPSGRGGFGYDPIFSIPDRNATLAQLSQDVKNEVSHRRKALTALCRTIELA